MLFNFIIRMLFAVVSAETKVDKRGKEFLSLKFDPRGQGACHWLKTVVVYKPNKKGNVVILVNHGGTRSDTGLEFPMSSTIVLKPTKDDLFIVLSRGKMQGFTTHYEVGKIIAATPQYVNRVTSESMF